MAAPDTTLLARALHTAERDAVELHAFATLGSTNAWLASGDGRSIDVPAVCVTDHQPAGAGRRGRTWESLPGNLTMSLLQRFVPIPRAPGTLSLVTGIAVADAVRHATGVPVSLKWPNDLVIEGSKVGGLLIESRHDVDRLDQDGLRVIGGIGVNLVADGRLAAIGATSLASHGVPPGARDALLADILCAVFDAWDRYATHGWSAFAGDWARLDALADRDVTVHDGPVGTAERWNGTARGVAPDGALQVATPAGLRTVYAADVSVRAASRS